MEYQASELAVAPRAGFEPATNRLTEKSRWFFPFSAKSVHTKMIF
jgi:hypothetical protein